ncbi:MAG: hypothetical protein KDI79_21025 [Anaerolineae bacterium]|nr:hypothetical protein [Anaerolineae bacterium]
MNKSISNYFVVILLLALIMPIFVDVNNSTALASTVFQSPIGTETPEPTVEPTTSPTDEPTATPTSEPTRDPVSETVKLVVEAPSSIGAGQTFSGSLVAKDVNDPGIYGVQLELMFDPALMMIDSVEANGDFDYVLHADADNAAGKILLIASRTGQVSGLTGGSVTLLTFQATAKSTPGTASFTFNNEKLSDPQAVRIEVTSEAGSIVIDGDATPSPTDEPTPVPTDEPTPIPTDEPTPVPTDEPTPIPTDEPTPVPTDEPFTAEVLGQVILAGRANNDWSGADISASQDGQPADSTATTDINGDFSMLAVPVGPGMTFTADAAGFLSAKCTGATVATPEISLNPVTLLSGDITNDDKIGIEDATAVGISFNQTGSGLAADINQDDVIDIFDLVLVSLNFNAEGPQEWICQ